MDLTKESTPDLLLCQNPDCDYRFFEQERDYSFCPLCGELVEENLPTEESDRLFYVARSLHFKRLFRIREKYDTDYVRMFVWAMVVFFFFFDLYDDKGVHIHHIGVPTPPASFLGAFSAMFVPYKRRLVDLREYFGEKVWYCRTVPGKVVKWLFMIVVLYLTYHVFIPYYITTSTEYLKEGVSFAALYQGIFIVRAALWIGVVGIVVVDLCEIADRIYCENSKINKKPIDKKSGNQYN